jgi:putative FmdB family regulatory protein
MPTYEYLCPTCSHRFETWQKMTDEPLTVCPACGKDIRRVFFPAGIVFKGSGFYKTDHRHGSSENGHTPKAEGTEAAKADGAKPSGESKATEGTSSESSSSTTSSENKVTTEAK